MTDQPKPSFLKLTDRHDNTVKIELESVGFGVGRTAKRRVWFDGQQGELWKPFPGTPGRAAYGYYPTDVVLFTDAGDDGTERTQDFRFDYTPF
jgi:hypothetical protein